LTDRGNKDQHVSKTLASLTGSSNKPSMIFPTRKSTIQGAGASTTGAGAAGFGSFLTFSFFSPFPFFAPSAFMASAFSDRCSAFALSATTASLLATFLGCSAAGAAAPSAFGFLTLTSGLISTAGTSSTLIETLAGLNREDRARAVETRGRFWMWSK